MKYVADEGQWYSILPEVWKNVMTALFNKNIVEIPDNYAHASDPESDYQSNMENGDKWGGL